MKSALRWIHRFWKQAVCDHAWQFSFNYYGDAIIYSGGMRSAWKCGKCGEWECRETLHETPFGKAITTRNF